MVEKLPFSKIDQVGIVVKDMEKAIEYYESLGIGPFKQLKNVVHIERMIRGKPANDVKNEVRVAQMGSVQLELVHTIEGDSLQKEFLETRGEGVNHLGFYVDDLDKEIAKLEKKGVKVLSRSRYKGGGSAVYLDTTKIGGVILELIQWPSE
jgi:methylmalonyl-CoA epimerase